MAVHGRSTFVYFLYLVLIAVLQIHRANGIQEFLGDCKRTIDLFQMNQINQYLIHSGIIKFEIPQNMAQYQDPSRQDYCEVTVRFSQGMHLQLELYALDIIPQGGDWENCESGLQVLDARGRDLYGKPLCMEGWQWEERHQESKQEKKIVESSPVKFRYISNTPARGEGYKVHFNMFRPCNPCVCQTREFRCRELSRCVHYDLTCDGWNDCGDDSDEREEAGCDLLAPAEICALIMGILMLIGTIVVTVYFIVQYRRLRDRYGLIASESKMPISEDRFSMDPFGYPKRYNSQESMSKMSRRSNRRDSDDSIDKAELEKLSARENMSERSYRSNPRSKLRDQSLASEPIDPIRKAGVYSSNGRKARGSSQGSLNKDRSDPILENGDANRQMGRLGSRDRLAEKDRDMNSSRDSRDRDLDDRERDRDRRSGSRDRRDRDRRSRDRDRDRHSDSDDRDDRRSGSRDRRDRRSRDRDRDRYSDSDDRYDDRDRRDRRRSRDRDYRRDDRDRPSDDDSDYDRDRPRRRRRRSYDRYSDEDSDYERDRERRRSRDRYRRDRDDSGDSDTDRDRDRRRRRDSRDRDRYDENRKNGDDVDGRPRGRKRSPYDEDERSDRRRVPSSERRKRSPPPTSDDPSDRERNKPAPITNGEAEMTSRPVSTGARYNPYERKNYGKPRPDSIDDEPLPPPPSGEEIRRLEAEKERQQHMLADEVKRRQQKQQLLNQPPPPQPPVEKQMPVQRQAPPPQVQAPPSQVRAPPPKVQAPPSQIRAPPPQVQTPPKVETLPDDETRRRSMDNRRERYSRNRWKNSRASEEAPNTYEDVRPNTAFGRYKEDAV